MPDSAATRVRVRFTKTGKIRFVSAIDLGRVWERSLRRADLPIAYSEGFSPHPRVSFPDALALGYASTGEYAELTFAGPVPVAAAVADLNAAFPAGIQVIAAVPVVEGAPKLSKWLHASLWELEFSADVPPADLATAVLAVAAADALPVPRERKGEVTHVDLRPSIHTIHSDGRLVRVVLHHVEPPVRPTEVHLALAGVHGPAPDLPEPVLATRIAQGKPAEGGLVEALSGELLASAGPPVMAAGSRRG